MVYRILTVAVVKINERVMKLAGLPQYSATEIMDLVDRDAPTWNIFAKGYTQGVNQCQEPKTIDKLKQYKPKCLMDLAAFVAAIRPGFKSQVQRFLNRESFKYGVRSFDEILKNDSTGSAWMLYQENTMNALAMAGIPMPETYKIIKAISKKKLEVINSAKDRFLEGFTKHIMSVSDATAEEAQTQSALVWKVIEDSAQYQFNCSHAVSVALDALYGAYLKAHYPLEYYTVLLEDCIAKGKKDKASEIKSEALRAFQIRVSHCKFRYDNRAYTFDKGTNTIFDALTSAKGISAGVAKAMYDHRNRIYATFTDLLYDLNDCKAINSAQALTLIRMGYFEEFGSTGKLIDIYNLFYNEKTGFKKTLCAASQTARLNALRIAEKDVAERNISPAEQVQFEIECYGTPVSVFPNERSLYAVIEVNTTYTPKLKLYRLCSGVVGTVKIRKPTFMDRPLENGEIVNLIEWKKKPAYTFDHGEKKIRPGVTDIWVEKYEVAN